MAEVQRSNQSGELAETFLQFIQMQGLQALHALGKHPNRPPNAPPPNLQLAKLFIDHMVMLRWKTQGNLNADEQNALSNAVTNLQGLYVEAMKEAAE